MNRTFLLYRNFFFLFCAANLFYTSYSQSTHLTDTTNHYYFPLQVGNTYQFFVEGFASGYSYAIVYRSVDSSRFINDNKYFYYNSEWLRYSKEDNLVYQMGYDSERVYMDFNLPPGGTFIRYIPNYTIYKYFPATVNEGSANLFNKTLFWKGYDLPYHIGSYNYEEKEKFCDSIGIYYYYFEQSQKSPSQYGFASEGKLISAILFDSLLIPHRYACGYFPNITVTPISNIGIMLFSLPFKVTHKYNIYPTGPYQANIFLSSVICEFFYQKGDSILNKNYEGTSNPSLTNYLFSKNLDSTLLRRGFQFKYRIIAVDKCYGPDSSFSPASGYYSCGYLPTNVPDNKLLSGYELFQNYPNPFNPGTNISYSIPAESRVIVKVHNILGECVFIDDEGIKGEGIHSFTFDGSRLGSGVYYYSISASSADGRNNFSSTKKMVLLR